jgi:hypothetical protein
MKGKCKPEEKQLKLLMLALSYLQRARNLSSHLFSHALIPFMTPVMGFIWTGHSRTLFSSQRSKTFLFINKIERKSGHYAAPSSGKAMNEIAPV